MTKTHRFFVIVPVVPPGRELMGSGDKASRLQLLFGLLCVSPDQTPDIVPGLRDHLHGGPLIIHAVGRGGPAVDQDQHRAALYLARRRKLLLIYEDTLPVCVTSYIRSN